jgi:Fe-S-cluster containining protein
MRWIRGGLRFECQPDCGQCCTQSVFGEGEVEGVFLTRRDLRRLERAGLSWAVVERDGHRVLLEESGTCVFLDGHTKRCGIYEARPTQCRNFPFSPGYDSPIATRSQWERAKELCPGIDTGRYYQKRLIRRIVRQRVPHGSFPV